MKLALSRTGHFLSKAEILGAGVFSPLSTISDFMEVTPDPAETLLLKPPFSWGGF